MCTNPSRPNTFTIPLHVCLFFPFTHPLLFALNGFHGCCVNCLLLSLLWFSVPSLHPSLCSFISPLSLSIEELGQGTAKIPVLFALFLYFTSPNFSLTPTNTLTHNIQHTIMSSLRRCMQNSGCFAFSTQPSRRHKEHKRGLTSYYKDKLTYKNTHKHPQ